ncbi:MAG TPA: NAD-binding protein, partial [Salinivirgaceae bacterium]|nr:NAD-binding protein [Salinivirgaceae bacterium]
MKIIIGGCGAVGTQLLKMLSNEGHDIVVIENDQSTLEIITANFDVLGLNGSITSFQTLKQAGVRDADLFVAVARELETNITACILAKRLGAEKTIARIDNSEYLQPTNRAHCIGMGIDALVYPQMLAAREIVNLLSQTGTSEVFNFSNGMLSLFVIKLTENAPVIGKTLSEVTKIEGELNYRAVAISRNGKTIIPKGSDTFEYDDVIYVISTPKGISKITQYSGQEKLAPENIMILGGSRIGVRAAGVLENQAN